MGGVAVALSGIAAGLLLEHGRIGQMLQPTAALIVFGGTAGAVLVQFPFAVVKQAIFCFKNVFVRTPDLSQKIFIDLMRYAVKARRTGMVSLDAELDSIQDPFLRKGLTLAVDGAHRQELQETMELELDKLADQEEQIPKVFEAAGGFAPTIGILGAVIGLIQVMQRLENINEVGQGIAVAFVATIYGVGSANLFFLPCAGRLRIHLRRRQVLREMTLDGIVAIMERTSPGMLESRLSVYLTNPSNARKGRLQLAKERKIAI
jgi:chemotaxis protein MotA